MSELRVIHVAESLDPSGGGLPAVVTQLSEAQREAGISAKVVCVHGAPPSLPKCEQLPKPSLKEAIFSRGSFSIQLQKQLAEADILHLHGVWDVPLLVAAKLARRCGKPYLVTPHGMLDPWSMQQKAWKKKLGLKLGFRTMLDGAAAIHWLNDDEKRLAEPLRLRAKPMVIPNGLPRSALAGVPPAGSFRERLKLGVPYILFLSRLHKKKGLDILADAFAIVARESPVHLIVAGPDGGARAEFEARIHELELDSRVSVIGPLYGAGKWEALADAACFCLPSRQEGFSMAILEAMASRIPVVISQECHFPEVAEAGAGYIEALNAEAIAAGLRKVLSNRESAEAMGRAGRELVEQRYTWDRVAKQMIECYRNLRGAPRDCLP